MAGGRRGKFLLKRVFGARTEFVENHVNRIRTAIEKHIMCALLYAGVRGGTDRRHFRPGAIVIFTTYRTVLDTINRNISLRYYYHAQALLRVFGVLLPDSTRP